jgi:GTP-binding protein LepA
VAKVPAPTGNADGPLRAMIIDSWFDSYVGVVMLVRVVDGQLIKGERIRMMATNAVYGIEHMGVFTPKSLPRESISAGEVGFVIAGIKELKHAKVGDTITRSDQPAETALEGFKEIQPQVFAGLYPVESHDYESLRDALEKLKLNDASLKYEPETSQALGFGFRCGFLGLLHLDIIQERLEREFDQDLITTAPTVEYEVVMKDGSVIIVENPSKLPETTKVIEIREPIITATILVPDEYLGNVITLCNLKRGAQVDLKYLGRQVMVKYDLPLNEVVMDFFDKLKSTSRGYASLDYEFKEFRAADLIKLAMIAVDRHLREANMTTRIIMQVHDELVLEVPETERTEIAEALPRLMNGVAKLAVPLLVEVGTGPNWETAH